MSYLRWRQRIRPLENLYYTDTTLALADAVSSEGTTVRLLLELYHKIHGHRGMRHGLVKPQTPIHPIKDATYVFSAFISPLTTPCCTSPNAKVLCHAYFRSAGVSACTTLVPSLNLVLNIRLAFWNMPSFKLTTMNCEPLNLVLIKRPIFCVCERSRAASTSSRMYMGAGLNWSNAMIRERAMSDLWTRNQYIKAWKGTGGSYR